MVMKKWLVFIFIIANSCIYAQIPTHCDNITSPIAFQSTDVSQCYSQACLNAHITTISGTPTTICTGWFPFFSTDFRQLFCALVADSGSGGSGTVTSVGLTGTNVFTYSGTPITTAGTFTIGLPNETGFLYNNAGVGSYTTVPQGTIQGSGITNHLAIFTNTITIGSSNFTQWHQSSPMNKYWATTPLTIADSDVTTNEYVYTIGAQYPFNLNIGASTGSSGSCVIGTTTNYFEISEATNEITFIDAFSPGGTGNDGTSGQLLVSNGTGVSPTWTTVPVAASFTAVAGTGININSAINTSTISIANTGVSAGAYGSATTIPTFTVNARGQITSITTSNINASLNANDTDGGSSYIGNSAQIATKNSSLRLGGNYATPNSPFIFGFQTGGAQTIEMQMNGINAMYVNTGSTNGYTGIGLGSSTNPSSIYFGDGVGYYANNRSTGVYNDAFGALSLSTNTTGRSNTATGVRSLQNSTTGSANTSTGQDALLNNTTGSYNTVIGDSALLSNTTGTYNTAIGQYANVNANNFTNCTVIGALAIGTASNQIMLGNSSVTSFSIGGSGVINGTPTNTVTPATWMKVIIAGTTYWYPLYQ
jgi:hypothetical protein